MAQICITGLPGGGKSLVGTHYFHKQLIGTKRRIVTNLPVYLGRTWEYLHARYGAEVDMSRVTMISKEEAATFYLHRGGGIVAPLPLSRKKGGDGAIDYANSVRRVEAASGEFREERVNALLEEGVLYIIDEAHVCLETQRWEDNADAGLFYLSQHRKLGDDVVIITQHYAQVHKSILRLVSEFWRVTNFGARVPFGVRLPDLFIVDVFTRPPSMLGTIIDTRRLRLDPEGLCSTYNTAAGVGLVGTLADTTKPKRGIPWQLAIVLCVAGVLGLYGALVAGVNLWKNRTLSKRDDKRLTVPAPVKPTNAPPVMPPALPLPPVPALHTNAAQIRSVSFEPPPQVPKLKWMVRRADAVSLGLTNGESFTVGDGRLVVVGQVAIIDGSRVYRLPKD